MASKRRLRRKACTGKVRYGTQEDCDKVMRAVNSKSEVRQRMSAYKCKFCNGWHFGHTPKKVIQSINAKNKR